MMHSITLSEQLIEEVRRYPILYNKTERGYKNVMQKTLTWSKIARKLNLTEEECCRKWKSLRDRYTRELKKVEARSRSGSESQQLESPPWELFDAFNFLKEHCQPNKKTISNFKVAFPPDPDEERVAVEETEEWNASEEAEGLAEPQPHASSSNTLEPRPSSCSSTNSDVTPKKARHAQHIKERGLQEINTSFIAATNAFQDMCANKCANKRKAKTADEEFGEQVVAFVSAITNPENRQTAKQTVMKYLADCVSEQYS